GILVLRTGVAEAAPAEPRRLAARVVDREEQPGPEEVLELVHTVHEREARVDDVGARETRALQMDAQALEVVGRPTELEPTCRVTVEPASAQIAACVTTVSGPDEHLVVEVDRGADRLGKALLPGAILRVDLVVVTQRDACARGESLDRVDEVEMLDVAHERDR